MSTTTEPEFDLFLSYASADLAAAEALEEWLHGPPRQHTIWRDRRGIPPGAPDFYEPIAAGIAASAVFVLLLSPRWLRSAVAAQEFADALTAGKKVVPVVHPAIPRDPTGPEGREKKSELMQAASAFASAAELNRFNWIWPVADEATPLDFEPLERALATDFAWAARHAVIVQRFNRWKALQNDSALLRGEELAELMADALADGKAREPILTGEQREFLLVSQREEARELSRVQGLYWGAQARAAAFAARECGETQPDRALLLAAEGAAVAPVPEARSAVFSLLHRHARLTKVLHGHGSARIVSGVAFSPDGRWLASTDRPGGSLDERGAFLLIHVAATGREEKRIPSTESLSAVAWGESGLAVASRGSIGWIRWDEWKMKFRANAPTSLKGEVAPDFLAFSSTATELPQGEILAWGTRDGTFGWINAGDHDHRQQALGKDQSNAAALTGLGWLADGRLITAEGGKLLARPFPGLDPAEEIKVCGRVLSLESRKGKWVAACVGDHGLGLLLGEGTKVEDFIPTHNHNDSLIAAWCGAPEDRCVLKGSAMERCGVPAVTLWSPGTKDDVLLQGEDELIKCVTADSTGRFVAAGSTTGRVWLWDRARQSHLVSRLRPADTIRCIATYPAGHLAAACTDGRILHFGPQMASSQVAEARAPFPPVRLMFTDGGRILLAQAEDGRLAVLEADGSAREIAWPSGSAGRHVTFATEAPIVAALQLDGTIEVLRLSEGALIPIGRIAAGHPVFALSLDPRGQRVVGAVNQLGLCLKAWRIDAPESEPVELGPILSGLPPVPIAHAGNGNVAAGDGADLMLVPLDDPERALRLREHDNPVKGIAAGRSLVATHACSRQDPQVDQVRLWTSEGQPLGPVTLPGHLISLAFSPDETALLALDQTGALWCVELQGERLISEARRVAGRMLTEQEERTYGVDAWRAQSPSA